MRGWPLPPFLKGAKVHHYPTNNKESWSSSRGGWGTWPGGGGGKCKTRSAYTSRAEVTLRFSSLLLSGSKALWDRKKYTFCTKRYTSRAKLASGEIRTRYLKALRRTAGGDLWIIPGLVYPVPLTKSAAWCPLPGLVPVHVEGTLSTFPCRITEVKLGDARFLHLQPAPTRAHAHLCEGSGAGPRAHPSPLPDSEMLPASPLPFPSSLPSILSLPFLHFPAYSYPSRGLDLYRSLLIPHPWTSTLFPDGPSRFPGRHLSFLLASLRRFPCFLRTPGFSVRRQGMRSPAQPRSPDQRWSRLLPPLKEPPPSSLGKARAPDPGNRAGLPGGPAVREDGSILGPASRVPNPEDTGTGPATRVTPLQHDPELMRSQFLQRVSDPWPGRRRRHGCGWRSQKKGSRNLSTQGVPGSRAGRSSAGQPLPAPQEEAALAQSLLLAQRLTGAFPACALYLGLPWFT